MRPFFDIPFDNDNANQTVFQDENAPTGHEQPTVNLDEPKFTCFPKLPIELRLKIWSLVESSPRIVSIRRLPLCILPIKPIATRATCVESRSIPSPHLISFMSVCIDPFKDTFLFPDIQTIYSIGCRWPSLAHKIRSLAIEPSRLPTRVAMDYFRYRILDIMRNLGNVEELIMDLERTGALADWHEKLRKFLETQRANDEDKAEDQAEEYDSDDSGPGPEWKVPVIAALPKRVGVEEISFEDEVMQWLETSGRSSG
jgi:2EXR family